MVSDDERREVAARLRALAGRPEAGGGVYNDDVLDALGMRRGRAAWLTTPDSVDRLADLIDRPTCRDEGSVLFTCPECGGYVSLERKIPGSPDAAEPYIQGYCPYCRTKVVRDDG